jgi:O-acetylserine/cysteine efflux transporter
LEGRDATAVTAVQFAAGALVALPFALLEKGIPHAPAGVAPVLVVAALAVVGTMVPCWLFAYGQARVPVQLAGAFVNLEPVVGAGLGWLAFGDVAAVGQVAGAVAVLAGIVISTLAARERSSPAQGSGLPVAFPTTAEFPAFATTAECSAI